MPVKLLSIALRLGELRWWFLAATALGAAAVAALLVFVPSALGFAAAGPFVMVPWGLFLITLGFRPGFKATLLNNLQMGFFSLFVVLGLAWPVIVLGTFG
jgi:hypothetical protein